MEKANPQKILNILHGNEQEHGFEHMDSWVPFSVSNQAVVDKSLNLSEPQFSHLYSLASNGICS